MPFPNSNIRVLCACICIIFYYILFCQWLTFARQSANISNIIIAWLPYVYVCLRSPSAQLCTKIAVGFFNFSPLVNLYASDALDGFGKFALLTMRSHVVLRMLPVLINLLVYDDGLAERHWIIYTYVLYCIFVYLFSINIHHHHIPSFIVVNRLNLK